MQQWLTSQPPSYALAKCKACSSPLVQLLQLNGELPDRFPGHERRIYVFACRNKACRRKEGSVRALRATRISPEAANKVKERREQEERERAERERQEAERKEKEKGLGEALFAVPKGGAFGGGGGQANPFATGGASASNVNPFAKPFAAASENPFSTSSASSPSAPVAQNKTKENEDKATQELQRTFAETLSLNNPQARPTGPPPPPEPWPAESDLPVPYPVSFLDEAEYETLDPQPTMPPQKISTSSMEIDDQATGSGSGGGKEDKNVFESSIDSTFQKFADRLAQNPDQAIRYEFGGAPLLYSKNDAVGKKLHDVPASGVGKVVPRCAQCGSERTFEVQMTPQAIVELESGEEDAGVLEGMDWGTVIVAVCARDCTPRDAAEGEAGYAEEWVGVQWEELTAKR